MRQPNPEPELAVVPRVARPLGVRSAILVLALLLPGGWAFAQQAPAPPQRSFGQLRLGRTSFTPFFLIRNLGIDTNVFNSAAPQQQSSPTVTLGVGERIDLVGPAFRVRGEIGADYVYYAMTQPGQHQGFDPRLAATIDYAVGPRLAFSGRARYAYVTGRPSFEIADRVRRLEKELGVGARYAFSARLAASAETYASELRYDEDPANLGSTLALALNGRQYVQRAALSYQLTPWTEVSVPVSWQQARFELDPARDADGRRVGMGLQFNARAYVGGSLEVGHAAISPVGSAGLKYSGPYALSQLRVRLGESTSVRLAAQRDVRYSYDASLAYYLYDSYEMGLLQRLGQRFGIEPFVGRFRLRYATPSHPTDLTSVWGVATSYEGQRVRYAVYAAHWGASAESGLNNHYIGWRFGFTIGTPRFHISERGAFVDGERGLGWISP
jgi:hypothetical protein